MGLEITDTILTGWKVVVIDDEMDNLYISQALLESYGAEVHTAANGADGIRLVEDVLPDFIISDMAMPQMSGAEMVKVLKQNPATRDIPVIALSAGSMLEDRDHAMQAGFHNYLIKPVHPQRFVSDVLNMLMDIPRIAQGLSRG